MQSRLVVAVRVLILTKVKKGILPVVALVADNF